MRLTLFLLTTAVVASPVVQKTYLTLRRSQYDPAELDTSMFAQGDIASSNALVPSSLQRRADTAPEGTEFLDVRNWGWDQTNTNGADRQRVAAAWKMAMELVASSIDLLKTLESEAIKFDASEGHLKPDGLPRSGQERKLEVRRFIAQYDPAYTQMFGADANSIGLIHNNFVKVRDGIAKQDADGRNNNLIYLTAIKTSATETADDPNNPGDPKERDGCNGREKGSPRAQAFVVRVSDMEWWHAAKNADPKWTAAGTAAVPPENAWNINFCEDFFKAPELTTMLQALKDTTPKQDVCDLSKLDTTARILLHEWTHFDFTLNTNRVDDPNPALRDDPVGWWKLPPLTIDETQGGFSDKKGKQYKASQPTFVGKFSSKSADSHAWYATYSYMNNLDGCAGVRWDNNRLYTAASCAADIWPQSEKKKTVKNNWPCYWPGDRDSDTAVYCADNPDPDTMNTSD